MDIAGYLRKRRSRVLVLALGLFVLAVALIVLGGYSIWISLLWNSLSTLEVPYDIVQVASARNPLIIVADLIDTFIFAVLAFFVAQWFAVRIKELNPAENLANARIGFLRKHVIIVPFNRFGRAMAWELDRQGMSYVCVGAKGEYRDYARKNKLLSIPGSTTLPETFIAAGIGRAKYVIACSEDDTENALIAITAKSVNSSVKIFSCVRDMENISKLHRAGAQRMVLPEVSAGTMAGNEIVKHLRGGAA
jgi:voltage-gated potassium channel